MGRIAYRYDNGLFKLELNSNFDIDKLVSILSTEALANAEHEIQEFLVNTIKSRIDEQHGPSNTRWKLLKKATVNRKGGNTKRYFNTGNFYNSIRGVVQNDEVTIFSTAKYAKMLHEGAVYTTTPKQSMWMWANLYNKVGNPFALRKVVIPARPLFGFDKKTLDGVYEILMRHYKKAENLGNG